MFRGRRALAVALMALFSIAGTLLLLEFITRLVVETPISLRQNDPLIGGHYRRDFRTTLLVPESGQEVFLRFNRDGFRGPDRERNKPPGTRRVAILGDSQIAAIATAEEDTLAARLEDLLSADGPWEVLNFGVSGASTAQELVLYRELVAQYQPDVVVVVLYEGNDFCDNSAELSSGNRIYLVDEAGELRRKTRPIEAKALRDWLNAWSRFYVWQKGFFRQAVNNAERSLPGDWSMPRDMKVHSTATDPKLDRAWALMQQLLRALRQEVEVRGSQFLLAVIPDPRRLHDDVWVRDWAQFPALSRTHAEQQTRRIVEEEKIDSLFLSASFSEHLSSESGSSLPQLFYGRIGHINVEGNALAALEIYNRITAAPYQANHLGLRSRRSRVASGDSLQGSRGPQGQ